MPERNPSVGNRLRWLAERKGIASQKELAKKLNVSDNAITNYFTKGRVPEWDVLLKASMFFGVSVDYLLTGKDFEGGLPAPDWLRPFLPLVNKFDERSIGIIIGTMNALIAQMDEAQGEAGRAPDTQARSAGGSSK